MESSKQKINLYERIASFLVIALGFLMPVFFLTTTTEFFEFNKLALLTVITVLLILLLGVKVIAGSSIQFIKSGLEIPLFIYLGIFLLATLFSIDKTASIWGSQGRWFPSLAGFVILFVFYYVSAPNFTDPKNIKLAIYALIGGGTVSSIVAILSYFGIYFGDAAYLKNPAFTLTGSTTTTVILAAISTVLALYFTYKEKVVPIKVALVAATVTNFVFVALLGTAAGWIIFILGAVLAISALEPKVVLEDRFSTMFLTTVLVAITLLNVFPATKSIILSKNYPAEIALPVKESWVIAASAIQDNPLLATGPSTFYLNFSRYRPLSVNLTNMWNIRFDKPYNEIFNTIATLGVLGLAAMLLLAVRLVRYALVNFKTKDEEGIASALAIGLLLVIASYFFTYATILNTFMMFFFLALLAANQTLHSTERHSSELITLSFNSFTAATTTIGETSAIRHEYANVVAITPFILVALFGTYLFAKTYVAEYYMRQAIVAALNNKAAQAYDFQGKAINMNPQRDVYHTSYAQTNLVLANALAANKNLTDQDKKTIQTLVAQSINSTRVATEVVNPLNVANWEARALIYRSLINAADNASDWAIGAYNTAIQLDPTNPALRVDLGGIYYAKGDFLSAANLFRQATALKSDYANAHYNFAQSLLNLKDFNNAKSELELTRSLVPQGSNDYTTVDQQITALTQQLNAAAAASTKPTVEQIAGVDKTAANTPQQPLTNPAQAQEPSLNSNALPATTNTGGTQPKK